MTRARLIYSIRFCLLASLAVVCWRNPEAWTCCAVGLFLPPSILGGSAPTSVASQCLAGGTADVSISGMAFGGVCFTCPGVDGLYTLTRITGACGAADGCGWTLASQDNGCGGFVADMTLTLCKNGTDNHYYMSFQFDVYFWQADLGTAVPNFATLGTVTLPAGAYGGKCDNTSATLTVTIH